MLVYNTINFTATHASFSNWPASVAPPLLIQKLGLYFFTSTMR